MRLGPAAALLVASQRFSSASSTSSDRGASSSVLHRGGDDSTNRLRERKAFFKNNVLKNQTARGRVNSKVPKVVNPFEAASDEEQTSADGANIPKKKSSVLERAQLLQNTKSSSIQKKQNLKECYPYAKDTSVGILSCGSDEICSPAETSDAGGFCVLDKSKKMNPKTSDHRSKQPKKALQVQPHFKAKAQTESADKKPCDPKQAHQRDPTLGVLSCNVGEVCQPDMDSVFGGTCVDASSAAAAQRKLIQKNNPLHQATRKLAQAKASKSGSVDKFTKEGWKKRFGEAKAGFRKKMEAKEAPTAKQAKTTEASIASGHRSLDEEVYISCDYSLFDESTLTGEVSCSSNLECNDGTGVCTTLSYTTVYVDGEYAMFSFCYELESIYGFGVPYADHSYCSSFNYEGDIDTCEISVYDTVCNSCTLDSNNCADFDCKSRSPFLFVVVFVPFLSWPGPPSSMNPSDTCFGFILSLLVLHRHEYTPGDVWEYLL